MILTGHEIARAVGAGEVTIDPFDVRQLNPNSYNYHLGDQLMLVGSQGRIVDDVRIPNSGYLLEPDRLYLGNTREMIGSERYVPTLNGRSSLGRLGLFLNVSADLGNLGAVHRWTLELVCVQPLMIYPYMSIGQACFWSTIGPAITYGGIYGAHSEPTPNLGRSR